MAATDLRAWFDSIDVDHSGSLDGKELQRALALGGLQFTEDQMHSMIRAFSPTKQLRLTMTEFGLLHTFLTTALDSFARHDHGASGSLEITELELAVRAAGFTLERPSLQALMMHHDVLLRGSLDRKEYVQLCLFLQASRVTFAAFDPTSSGRVSLDFSQFVYAASHVV